MDNVIVIDKKKKEEYNILFKIEVDDITYVVYTRGETNEDDEKIAYGAKYEMIDGKQILVPVDDDSILEFLDSVLIQIQNKMNKEVIE